MRKIDKIRSDNKRRLAIGNAGNHSIIGEKCRGIYDDIEFLLERIEGLEATIRTSYQYWSATAPGPSVEDVMLSIHAAAELIGITGCAKTDGPPPKLPGPKGHKIEEI